MKYPRFTVFVGFFILGAALEGSANQRNPAASSGGDGEEVFNPTDVFNGTRVGLAAKFVSIKSGEFELGSPSSEDGRHDDEALHHVKLSKGYEMQATEVTQLQYFLVMRRNPAFFRKQESCDDGGFKKVLGQDLCVNHPVENVSWDEAHEFIMELNRIQDKHVYRLPTEAEWEYAARGGMSWGFPYSFGSDREELRSNFQHVAKELGAYSWCDRNSGGRTHAVASKKANPWGLHDMHGNVWEWVKDFYGDYPAAAVTDPAGPVSGSYRVIRGGSWSNCVRGVRTADRSGNLPGHRDDRIGLRLVRAMRD